MAGEGGPTDELRAQGSSGQREPDTARAKGDECREEVKTTSSKLILQTTNKLPRTQQRKGGRTDQGRRHAARDSVLSRGLLELLSRHGENLRTLRRMKAELRGVLKPEGSLGKLFFDRFWSCVLRLIYVGRLEEAGLEPRTNRAKGRMPITVLREGSLPVLLTPEEQDDLTAGSETVNALEPDVFRRLALIARYDRAASREMFRMLGLLLLMRDDGESGLANGIRAAAGIKSSDEEGC